MLSQSSQPGGVGWPEYPSLDTTWLLLTPVYLPSGYRLVAIGRPALLNVYVCVGIFLAHAHSEFIAFDLCVEGCVWLILKNLRVCSRGPVWPEQLCLTGWHWLSLNTWCSQSVSKPARVTVLWQSGPMADCMRILTLSESSIHWVHRKTSKWCLKWLIFYIIG